MRIGSLFSGYGGLDMAVGGELAWYSEIEPAACKVMEAHHPGVPNLGDITKVDWSAVEPVDVITGGYPCQPFSTAGNRKGKNDERHLWPYVRDAIGAIRPRYAVLENVRGHLSLGFADVLADLAYLGLSARWGIVRAADAGAPHNRARLFIVADTSSRQLPRLAEWWGLSEPAEHGAAIADPDGTGGKALPRRSRSGDTGRREPVERCGQIVTNPSSERHGRGQRPASVEGMGGTAEGSRRQASPTRQKLGTGSHWGEYAPAISRWQHVIGRPAPAPTIRRNDRDRLNPVFVEWMMGLPEGWVTGHGLSPSQELKMLGNGVVPQQAALALRLLGAA
jgi:DNA (cytosine-5)-methyltransferase 1